mmetsp:Transcript_14234/g.25014  ORF Transcript_14234/g.25014 Transcript_14234/m.25014 type:complete len:101 (-) Transcript_14234:1100-1402(-)
MKNNFNKAKHVDWNEYSQVLLGPTSSQNKETGKQDTMSQPSLNALENAMCSTDWSCHSQLMTKQLKMTLCYRRLMNTFKNKNTSRIIIKSLAPSLNLRHI